MRASAIANVTHGLSDVVSGLTLVLGSLFRKPSNLWAVSTPLQVDDYSSDNSQYTLLLSSTKYGTA